MSIILSKDILNRALEIVEKAVPRKSNIQLLENILFESGSNNIIISGTNVELQIKVSLPYDGNKPGKVLLPPKITEIVRFLPDSEVQFELNPENFQVALSSGPTKYNLFGADPADFPLIEEKKASPEKGKAVAMEPAELRQLLKMVILAASTEETRPAFTGVLFEFDGNRWSLISSDTYRVAVKNIFNEAWSFAPTRCLVPARALRELLKILDQSEEQAVLFPDREQMVFDLGPVYFAARLLNEKYPDISSVIPERYTTRITIKRAELEETIGRAALLAEGPNNAVHLTVGSSSLAVRVSSQVGRMEEELAVQHEGEEVDLYINSRFIMDILKVAPAERMIVDFHGKTGPVIFRLPGDESYIYLVLPIKME